MTSTEVLQYRRALLVEDEAIIAIHLELMLGDLGITVIQTAAHINAALNAARSIVCDFAILDVNLNGTLIYPVADVLKERNIPYIFTTGYSSSGLDKAYAHTPKLLKPIEKSELQKLLLCLFKTRQDQT